jgi:uncharacterized delta-60 repeat protein
MSGRRGKTIVLALAALLCTAAVAAAAGRSALDRGFGDGGRVLSGLGSHPQTTVTVEDVAVAPDGRVAVATEGSVVDPIQVTMLRRDGSPDASFSGDGAVQPQLEPGPPLRGQINGGDTVRIAFVGNSLLVACEVDKPKGKEAVELRMYGEDGSLVGFYGDKGRVLLPRASSPVALFPTGEGRAALFAKQGLVRLGPDGAPLNEVRGSRDESFVRAVMGPEGTFLARGARVDYDRERAWDTLVRYTPDPGGGRSTAFDPGSPLSLSVLGVQAGGAALIGAGNGVVRLQADDKTPDPSFQGKSLPCRAGQGSSGYVGQIIGLPDGEILAAGSCGLVRLQKDGTPDPAFGLEGLVPVDLGGVHVAVGADGKIVYVAWNQSLHKVEVGRLDENGAPDSSFGAAGKALVTLNAPISAKAFAVAAAPRGRLIAAGEAFCGEGCGGFALARYLPGGQLDRTFGEGGRVVSGQGGLGSAHAVAVAPDGSIFAGGTTGYREEPGGKEHQAEFALAKFRPSGRLDPSFGDGGVVAQQISPHPDQGQRSEIEAIALQRDGKVVAAGLSYFCGYLCFTVARYLPSGKLDRSFAGDGVLRLKEKGAYGEAVAIQRNGKIVVSGGSFGSFVTVRLTRHGRLDRSFGGDGVVIHKQRIHFKDRDHAVIDGSVSPKALTIGRDGSIAVAGGGRSLRSFVERYLPDGHRDPRFGNHGRVFLGGFSVDALRVAPCGLVLGGTIAGKGREQAMGLTTLSRNGRKRSAIRRPFGPGRRSFGAALALQPGRTILAGSLMPFKYSRQFALAAFRTKKLFPSC